MKSKEHLKKLLQNPRSEECKEFVNKVSKGKNGLIYSTMHSMSSDRIRYNIGKIRGQNPEEPDFSKQAEIIIDEFKELGYDLSEMTPKELYYEIARPLHLKIWQETMGIGTSSNN